MGPGVSGERASVLFDLIGDRALVGRPPKSRRGDDDHSRVVAKGRPILRPGRQSRLGRRYAVRRVHLGKPAQHGAPALTLSPSGFETKHYFQEVLHSWTAVWPWQRFPAESVGHYSERLRT